ncbi:MAG: ABC transporter permease [Albidovulum sp.]|nr:ABC transporter permease [Albidovulum sp.]MDE0303635.1 ABC transporter permease [Albidovulum sp.]MDE0533138.1 ABC transporter permease [Albidovulum sp.]
MAYLIKRIVNSAIILFLTVSFVFFAGRLIGDPALNMLGPGASDVALENLRRAAGLNDPILIQYFRYVVNLLSGDFGISYRYGFSVLPSERLSEIGQPVIDIVLERLPATFFLAAAAMGFAVPIGVFMGVTAAAYPRSAADRIVTVLSLAGVSIVQFWLGLMLIVFFAVQLGWLPTGGYGEWQHVILPALTLAARPIGRIAQVTRSAVLEELAKPYIMTAHAKGVPVNRVVYLHSLKNAAIPIVTMIGDELSALLTGAILVEKIFAWPGIGLLIIDSLSRSDLPLIQASIVVVAALVVCVNLLVDLAYRLLNPRIRFGKTEA